MEIKLGFNELLIIASLFVFYQVFFLKFIYLLVIPGLFILLRIVDWKFSKSLLFSVPLSLVFYVFPYFLLTRAGFSIPIILYLLIPFLLIGFMFFNKELSLSFSKKFNLFKTLSLVIVLVFFFLVFKSYSFKQAVPLTAGANGLLSVIELRDGLLSGSVPAISPNLYSTNHFFYTYPPLSQLTVSFLSVIQSEPVYRCYNLSFSFMIIYFLFGCFHLFKHFKLSDEASTMALISFIGLPLIMGELTYSGNVSSAFMYSLYPVVLIGLFSLFKKLSSKELFIHAVVFAAFFLAYHYISYFVVLAIGLLLITHLLVKRDKIVFKQFFFYFLLAGLFILAWMIRYFLLKYNFILVALEGSWNQRLTSLTEFLSYITASVDSSDLYKQVVTFTPLFFYLGLITSIIPKFNSKKIKLTKDYKLSLLFTVFTLALILIEIFPISNLIPLRSNYYRVYRYWIILVPLFGLGIARLINSLIMFDNKFVIILLFLIPLLFYSTINSSANKVEAWLNEQAIINDSGLSSVYKLIDPSIGRVASYGSFGPSMIPAINHWTNASMFGGYNFQRHAIKNYYNHVILPITSASMDFLKKDVSPVRVYNTYQKSWTNTILFFSCTEKGFKALNKTIQYSGYQLIADSECLKIISPVNLSHYVESVVLSKGNESIINEVMNLEGGYQLVFPEKELSNEYYTNIVTNLDINSYVTNTTPLMFKRLSDTELLINSKPGFILVKEPFLPTWHAYQGRNELEIIQSYYGFMILKSESSVPIDLINKPHYSEVLGLFIFLIGCLISYYFINY